MNLVLIIREADAGPALSLADLGGKAEISLAVAPEAVRERNGQEVDLVLGVGVQPGTLVHRALWAAWQAHPEADVLLLADPEAPSSAELGRLLGADLLSGRLLTGEGMVGRELHRRLECRQDTVLNGILGQLEQGKTCLEIAYGLGICERTLRERVRCAWGQTIARVKTVRRLQQARRLLMAQPAETVARVACAVHFAPASFTRVFHQEVGMPPLQYRLRVHSILAGTDVSPREAVGMAPYRRPALWGSQEVS